MLQSSNFSGQQLESLGSVLKPTISHVRSLTAEAESIEGLFDDLVGFVDGADSEYVRWGDVLLQLAFSEDDSPIGSLHLRPRQQDVGSMASKFQESGWDPKNIIKNVSFFC